MTDTFFAVNKARVVQRVVSLNFNDIQYLRSKVSLPDVLCF
jgi:hypothetical protein